MGCEKSMPGNSRPEQQRRAFMDTPRFIMAASILGLAQLLAACTTTTRVTLLPQASGKPSAVDVSTDRGTEQISTPYQVATVGRLGGLSVQSTTPEQVLANYPSLLALQPLPPDRFVLEFEAGSSQLTPESQILLDTVIIKAQARPGGEIVVIGHSDRQGTEQANDQLSLERARWVRNMLLERGFQPDRVEAVGRGEREPLIPTDDGVAEPRNRRAEVLVR